MTTHPIRCTGRPVRNNGQPYDVECGREYHHGALPCNVCTSPVQAIRDRHAAAQIVWARAAGWSIGVARHGPAVMCPTCRLTGQAHTAPSHDLRTNP